MRVDRPPSSRGWLLLLPTRSALASCIAGIETEGPVELDPVTAPQYPRTRHNLSPYAGVARSQGMGRKSFVETGRFDGILDGSTRRDPQGDKDLLVGQREHDFDRQFTSLGHGSRTSRALAA